MLFIADEKKFLKHTNMGFSFEDLVMDKIMLKTDHQLDQRFER
jgi:hypothetical protein